MYDISYSIHVTSYPLYLWHHIHYVWQHNTVCCSYHTRHMCDIICTTDDITSTLSHQTTVFMMSHSLQAWYHTHPIRHHTLCIFVITTSLCHHIPTFLWHHTHSMCDTICTPYNIISTPYVIPLLYLWHYSLYIWNLILYVGHICTIHVTLQPLICVITLTLLTTSHTLYDLTLR